MFRKLFLFKKVVCKIAWPASVHQHSNCMCIWAMHRTLHAGEKCCAFLHKVLVSGFGHTHAVNAAPTSVVKFYCQWPGQVISPWWSWNMQNAQSKFILDLGRAGSFPRVASQLSWARGLWSEAPLWSNHLLSEREWILFSFGNCCWTDHLWPYFVRSFSEPQNANPFLE